MILPEIKTFELCEISALVKFNLYVFYLSRGTNLDFPSSQPRVVFVSWPSLLHEFTIRVSYIVLHFFFLPSHILQDKISVCMIVLHQRKCWQLAFTG